MLRRIVFFFLILLTVVSVDAQRKKPALQAGTRLAGPIDAQGNVAVTNAADVVLDDGTKLSEALFDLDSGNDLEFGTLGRRIFINGSLGGNRYMEFKGFQWVDFTDANITDVGDVAADSVTLDRSIEDWDDIGVTYSNAIRLNESVSITNTTNWAYAVTDGDLVGTNIVLDIGETITFPSLPFPHGIASYEIKESGYLLSSVNVLVGGQPVSVPYYGTNGVLQIEAVSAPGIPGEALNLVVEQVILHGVTDLDEAQMPKEVTRIDLIEDQPNPNSATKRQYVDDQTQAAKDYADTQLADYVSDADKTLRGSELRLGNMWVVSPADSTGERWVMSGGEIAGNGELMGTTNELVFAKNGYPALCLKSDSSGLNVTNFTLSANATTATVTLNVATNGVRSAPYAEWCSDLRVGEWERVQSYTAQTYPTVSNGTYTLTYTVNTTNDTFYTRAMQDEGDSVWTVKTDVWDFGGAQVTNAESLSVSNLTIAGLPVTISNGFLVVEQP